MASIPSQALLVEDKTMLHVLYALFAAYPFFGIPAVLALCINLLQLFDENKISKSTRYHLKSQRSTSFIALFILFSSYHIQNKLVSLSFLFCGCLWFTYRMMRGWLYLIESDPI